MKKVAEEVKGLFLKPWTPSCACDRCCDTVGDECGGQQRSPQRGAWATECIVCRVCCVQFRPAHENHLVLLVALTLVSNMVVLSAQEADTV